MANNMFDLPQTPAGDEKEKIRQIYSYLYQLAEELNRSVTGITEEMITYVDAQQEAYEELAAALTGSGTGTQAVSAQQTRKDAAERAATLKAMIIKNAKEVSRTLQTMTIEFRDNYVAQSDFGTYFSDASNTVTVTPTGTTQEFTLAQAIRGARESLGNFDTEYTGYIKSGYLRTEDGVPIYGVAIGKDVVTFSSDGTPVYNDGNKVAELTDEELSFWQDGVKIGYYSNRRFYILEGQLVDRIIIGEMVMEADGTSVVFRRYEDG